MASPILININNSILQSCDYSSTGRRGCAENLTPLARHGPRAGHPSMRACVLEQHGTSLNILLLKSVPMSIHRYLIKYVVLTIYM